MINIAEQLSVWFICSTTPFCEGEYGGSISFSPLFCFNARSQVPVYEFGTAVNSQSVGHRPLGLYVWVVPWTIFHCVLDQQINTLSTSKKVELVSFLKVMSSLPHRSM